MLDEEKSQVWRSRSCGSAPSQEVEQVSHILIFLGSIRISGGPCRSCPCLSIGPVSKPCDRSPKLLRSRTYVRGGTLALLAEGVLVKILMQPHLSPVVGRLLAGHMSYIVLQPLQVSWGGLRRARSSCFRVQESSNLFLFTTEDAEDTEVFE